MPRELHPAEADQQAARALSSAGFTGLDISSQRTGTAYVTTTVRGVSVGNADRVLAVLRNLPYAGPSGKGWRGKTYEVWISRRVGMAG
jgi:hypothetical protein